MDPTCLRTRARRVDPYSLTFVTQSHNFLSMTPESKLYLVSLPNNFCCFLVKIFEHLFFFLIIYIYIILASLKIKILLLVLNIFFLFKLSHIYIYINIYIFIIQLQIIISSKKKITNNN